MRITLDECNLVEINGDSGKDESVLDIEKSNGFKIHINEKYRDIVTIDYYKEEVLD